MSVEFRCPHCGATTNVADQYIGQTGPCAQCGRPITVPYPGQPAPAAAYAAPPSRGMSTGVIVAIVLVVVVFALLFCGGVLAALLLPAVQGAREAARQAACTNNMKQIELAMQIYAVQHGTFPPAYIADENGKPMHSWRVLLLPYLEEQALYDQYDFDAPWDSPQNSALMDLMPNVYRCPSDVPNQPGDTSYVMVVGPRAFSTGPKGRSIAEFSDGTTATIALVEASGSGINWLEPKDWDTSTATYVVNDPGEVGLQSNHANGCNVTFADGSVDFIEDYMPPEDVKAMCTVDGGEAVTRYDMYD